MNLTPNNWKNPKYGLMLASLLVLGAVIIVSIIRDRIVNDQEWQINVSGQGRVSYQPDEANVNLGVKVDKAAKAEDALKQLNDKINKISEAIKKSGIAPENIRTQNYLLEPHYDIIGNISKLTGYDANQIIMVKIKDIRNNACLIAKVISETAKAGANQINGITFENSDIDKIKQEARLAAIADARNKSAGIAQALGVRLGDVTGWWENIISPTDGTIYGKGGADDTGTGGGTPAIPAGNQEIITEVNISYRIK
jgi:uncharacterized protein YggE